MRYHFEDYALDIEQRELRRNGTFVSVEPQVFDLLTYLIQNRARVVSKEDLFATIWGGRVVSESALTTRINAARTALGDSGEAQRLIKTLPRKGLRFVGLVREEQLPAAAVADQGAEPPKEPLSLPDKPSIAVLSFTNMSADPDQHYFADGMAEEIITALSRCRWLFVIARNSSFSYKAKSVDVRQIGRELGVRYVLEGSVRRSGNRLRITGQLVDATSGVHIWADRFEGEISDVFDLQDRITESVVGAIEPTLQLAEIERLKRRPPANLNAYDLLLRAQQLEYEYTDESLGAAIGCLKQALAIDPSYAPAMALAAYCYVERRLQGWARDPETEATEILRLASRAVELAGDDANVLWMAAYAGRSVEMDSNRATELINRSLQLNPNSAMALTIAAWNQGVQANPASALELLRRAERISPRDPRAWYMATVLSFAYFVGGQFERAASAARRALVHKPNSTRALRLLAASLQRLGDHGGAAQVTQSLLAVEPELTISKTHARFRHHWPKGAWKEFEDGLRLAGVPE